MLAVGLIIQTHADTATTINQMLVKPNMKIKSLLARSNSDFMIQDAWMSILCFINVCISNNVSSWFDYSDSC